MKNFENEKVLWKPALCKHLGACYRSRVNNRKCLALKISVTKHRGMTVWLCPSFHGTGRYCLVSCCRCCMAKTSLTWNWLFLGKELNFNFWFAIYIYIALVSVTFLPKCNVYIQISFWELFPLASSGQQNHLFSSLRWLSSVETPLNGFRVNIK